MLTRLTLTNFQSIASSDLRLGRLTVIVGPSSSGKSAVMRALRTLASNSRGAAWITQGAKTGSITATGVDDGGDSWAVTLERSATTATYRTDRDGTAEVFTKLAGAVPEAVTRMLGVEPASSEGSLHFAGQFDRPYLLDESGAAVARVLGELTGVNVVLEAAREASRRRAAVAATLKTRQGDLAALTEAAQAFAGLPARLAAVTAGEEAVRRAGEVAARAERLRALVADVEVAEVAVRRSEAAVGVAVPDYEPVADAVDRRAVFGELLRTLAENTRAAAEGEAAVTAVTGEIEDFEAELHEVLTEAGTCPVCGQSTAQLGLSGEPG